MDQNDRLESKIDRVLDVQNEHSVVLARHGVLHEKNAEELQVHIRRTDLLTNEVHQLWKFKFLVAGVITAVSVIAPILLKILGFK